MFGLFSSPLTPGTPAPPFTMKSHDGQVVSLLSLRGKNVILVFYPADETPGCTAQVCELRDSWQSIRSRNAVVFGVNPGNAASHDKFVQKHSLPFPLLVDEKQQTAKLYNASGLFVRRTVYLIDPEGVIRFAERGSPKPAQVLKHAR
jgi:thioredoxin-dependent peroxiredoxin